VNVQGRVCVSNAVLKYKPEKTNFEEEPFEKCISYHWNFLNSLGKVVSTNIWHCCSLPQNPPLPLPPLPSPPASTPNVPTDFPRLTNQKVLENFVWLSRKKAPSQFGPVIFGNKTLEIRLKILILKKNADNWVIVLIFYLYFLKIIYFLSLRQDKQTDFDKVHFYFVLKVLTDHSN
jgi:hypothetical protein